MARYLLVRLGSLLVSVVAATLVVFVIMHAIPGGPFDAEKAPLTADQVPASYIYVPSYSYLSNPKMVNPPTLPQQTDDWMLKAYLKK